MKTRALMIAITLLAAAPALAQQPIPTPLLGNSRPLKGPPFAVVMEGAMAALEACKAKGHKVGVAVVDDGGGIRLVIAADGAMASDSNGARRAATYAAFKKAPGQELFARIKTDKAMEAEYQTNYTNWLVREGSFPILDKGEVVGAIAVEGHPHDAAKEIECARIGRDRIQARMR